jgi:cytochrome c-type biogenesis protein CcmF
MAFQVLVPTSFPVLNKIIQVFGIESNLAPPAEQAVFYSKFQIWGGVLIAIVSGTAQFFWWKHISKPNLWQHFALPIIISMALSVVVFKIADISNLSYILLLTAVIYSLITNGNIGITLFRKKSLARSGGAISHIGIALMLLGILFSAGYSNIISLNKSGMKYSEEMSDELNRENVLLFLNEPRQMNEYQLIYKGRRLDVKEVPGYVNKNLLFPTPDKHFMIAKADYVKDGKKLFSAGDTLEVHPENTYYEVEYQKAGNTAFTLYPRAQVNPNMGLIVSPDIQRKLSRDLYTHISSIPNPESPMEWIDTSFVAVQMNQEFLISNHTAVLTGIKRLDKVAEIPLEGADVAVEAEIEIQDKEKKYIARPVFIIQDKRVGNIPDVIEDLAVKISFTNILPQENRFEFIVQTAQKDYIIMKAIEMPLINVLWLGTLILMIGMTVSFSRRYTEFRKNRETNH